MEKNWGRNLDQSIKKPLAARGASPDTLAQELGGIHSTHS
jgi:hypothetical protein